MIVAYSKITGVYRIYCSGNNKVYIGSAVSIRQRLACHFSMLKRGVHTNKHLQNAYDKYGCNTFWSDILIVCDETSRIKLEQELINVYNAADPEYGMNNSWTAVTSVGFKHSDETKARMSILAKTRSTFHLVDYWRGKTSPMKGKEGRKWSDEEKLAASISRKGRIAWNKGIPHTEKAKIKISIGGKKSKQTTLSELIREKIKQLRVYGMTYANISKEIGLSISQCQKIFNYKEAVRYSLCFLDEIIF